MYYQLKIGYWASLLHTYITQLDSFPLKNWYLLTQVILVTLGGILTLYILLRFFHLKMLLKKKHIFLQLIPPTFSGKSSYPTQQLFSILHTLGNQRPIMDKLLGWEKTFSLEIVSTRNEGIRYIIVTTLEDAPLIEQSIRAYLPTIQIKQIEDYLFTPHTTHTKITTVRLKNHYATNFAVK